MLIVTQNTIDGREITETLGLARGSSVRTRAIGRDIIAGVRTFLGGEVREYSELLSQARQQALDRLAAHASEMGADAVVSMRFVTSNVAQGVSEILAYGTAVKTKAGKKPSATKA